MNKLFAAVAALVVAIPVTYKLIKNKQEEKKEEEFIEIVGQLQNITHQDGLSGPLQAYSGEVVEFLIENSNPNAEYEFVVEGVEDFDYGYDPHNGYFVRFVMPNNDVNVSFNLAQQEEEF